MQRDEYERMRAGERRQRPEPLGNAVFIYENEDDEIPGTVRIPFDNGRTVLYRRVITQPAPQVMECVEIIRKWHGYTPPARRRRKG